LLAQPLVELQPPPAVAQRDRDGALGVALADDEAVEFGDDLAGGKIGHVIPLSFRAPRMGEAGIPSPTRRVMVPGSRALPAPRNDIMLSDFRSSRCGWYRRRCRPQSPSPS